ncbi:MAG: segregation and condensation protein A [Deltaproteobacteria bacterium]
MSYRIKIELFEGPLDLLLYLVKRDHLNIYDIPISTITGQYMAYLELMKILDLNIAGEFLVMAATLMQIKSKMLLPPDESVQPEEELEDPREELVKQLLEYERFKEVAQELRKREDGQREVFRRPQINEKELPETAPEYFEASIFDLITAFSKALEETPKELFYNVIKEEFTIEDKVHHILHRLLVVSSLTLTELFAEAKNKLDIIVTFLAVLELIRLKEITALQRELFGEIEVLRNQQNIIPDTNGTETKEEGPAAE